MLKLRQGVRNSLSSVIQNSDKRREKERFQNFDDDLSSVLLGEQDDEFQTHSYTSKSTFGDIHDGSINESKYTDVLGIPTSFVKTWSGDDHEEPNDLWSECSPSKSSNHDTHRVSDYGLDNRRSRSRSQKADHGQHLFDSNHSQQKGFTPRYKAPSFDLPVELRRPSISSRSHKRGNVFADCESVSNHSSSTITTKQEAPQSSLSPRTPPPTNNRSRYPLSIRTPGNDSNNLFSPRTPGTSMNLRTTAQSPCKTPTSHFMALADHGDWRDLEATTNQGGGYVKSPDRKPRHLDVIRQLRLARVDDSSSSSEDDENNNDVDSIVDHIDVEPLLEFSDDDDDDSIGSLVVTEDDKPEAITRKVSRMSSGQLRRWDGFQTQVSMLVRQAMPENVKDVPKLMNQFAGREAELMQTLQNMLARTPQQRCRARIPKSKAIQGTRRVSSVQMDAIAIIAAASTLDDQLQAVKPEFVVDEGPPGRRHDEEEESEEEESSSYDSDEDSSSEEVSSSEEEDEDDDEDYESTSVPDEDELSVSSSDDGDEEETNASTFWNGYR